MDSPCCEERHELIPYPVRQSKLLYTLISYNSPHRTFFPALPCTLLFSLPPPPLLPLFSITPAVFISLLTFCPSQPSAPAVTLPAIDAIMRQGNVATVQHICIGKDSMAATSSNRLRNTPTPVPLRWRVDWELRSAAAARVMASLRRFSRSWRRDSVCRERRVVRFS